MVKSKLFKFIISFISLLSVFSLVCLFPASAFFPEFLKAGSMVYVGGSTSFNSVEVYPFYQDEKYTTGFEVNNSSDLNALGVWDIVLYVNSEYNGSPGVLSFVFTVDSTSATSSSSYATFLNVNPDNPYVSGQGVSYQGSANKSYQSFNVSVPVSRLGSYIYIRFNHFCNWKYADILISDVDFTFNYASPSVDDEDMLSSFDEQQDEMLSSGVDNVSSYGDELNNGVLSFIQSAPNVLSFVSGMFNRLVGDFDFVNVLIMVSLCFAVVPALFGLVTHIVKSVGKFKDD